jgi:glutathione S-transferase
MKIWHGPRSRSDRIVWLCEEMGLPYEIGEFRFRQPNPEFDAVNPLGGLPALQDEGHTLVESVAILLYIAGRYGPTPLMPAPGDADYADCLQYLMIGEANLGSAVNVLMHDRYRCPEAQRGGFHPTTRHAALLKTCGWLADGALKHRPYVAGERFTVADICIGHSLIVISTLLGLGGELPETLKAYVARLSERPAYQRVAAMHLPMGG